jgi:hypothetical protein
MSRLVAVAPIVVFAMMGFPPAHSQTIQCTGQFNAPGKDPGFGRGMQATMYCGNNPESWVRGSASLDKSSGVVSITEQLETDSALAGPKGKVIISIRNANNQELTGIETAESGIGGKQGGQAVIRNISGIKNISASSAEEAASCTVTAQCTGSINAPIGINPGDVISAIKTIFGH